MRSVCLLETCGGRCEWFVAFERSRLGWPAKCLPVCLQVCLLNEERLDRSFAALCSREEKAPDRKQKCPTRFLLIYRFIGGP